MGRSSKPSRNSERLISIRAKRFSYTPLNAERKEIRLLTVHATFSGPTDTLRCTIEHASLFDSPQYETISYCWGDKSRTSYIILEGCIFDVPESAQSALRRMRHPDRDRRLWIDAVCINQKDPEERGHQVALMYDVYRNTTMNLIWLGDEPDETAQHAITAIQSVIWQIRRETDDYVKFKRLMYDDRDFPQYSEPPLIIDFELQPLLELFARPWFRRLWVVQEAALAPGNTCHYGSLRIDFLDVLRAAQWLYYQSYTLVPFDLDEQQGIRNAAQIWAFTETEVSSSKHRDMLDLLSSFHGLDALDSRDHVYALLGLHQHITPAGTDCRSLLAPDYQKSLVHVFRDATRFVIDESGDLSVFNQLHGGSLQTGSGSWPSWVPRWDANYARDSVKLSYTCQAGGQTVMGPAYASADDHDPDALLLSGFSLDRIACMTSTFMDNNRTGDRIASFLSAVRSLQETTCNEGNIEDRAATLGVVLTGGHDYELNPITADIGQAFYLAYVHYVEDTGTLPPLVERNQAAGRCEPVWMAADFVSQMRKHCHQRRAFVTNTGHFGTGPRTLREGDVLAILNGCHWPVVLRPIRRRRKSLHCRLSGVSYVYGIMDGEAVTKHKAEGGKDMVFRIH